MCAMRVSLIPRKISILCLAAGFAWCGAALAMEVVGFSEQRHSRFASGYNSDPVVSLVPNTSPEFFAAAYDLTGIGWNAANRRQSYVFLSRKHMLVAQHFSPGQQVQYFSKTTGLGGATRASQVNIPESDIGIVRLTDLLPAAAEIATYPLLDLPTTNSYVGRDLVMYGWWARVGAGKVSSVLPDGRTISDSLKKYLFEHEAPAGRADFVTLQDLDSGSPSFIPFDGELTLTGNHYYILRDAEGAYVGGGDSFLALPEVVTRLNDVLGEDGFALQFLTQPAKSWSASNSDWGRSQNWSPRNPPSASQSVGFDGSAAQKSIALGADRAVKGLKFTGTVSQSGFSFQAGHRLSIGYVGIRNNAAATQIFDCEVALTEPQHWTSSAGDIALNGAVDLGAQVLNISGPGNVRFYSGLSGSGGLTVQSGTAEINAVATYTGATYLYGGSLIVRGGGQLAATSAVVFSGGRLVADGSKTFGPAKVADSSTITIESGDTDLVFAAAAAVDWRVGAILSVEGFDSDRHSLRFGDQFGSLTPAQRAAILINGEPVIHRTNGSVRIASPFERWLLAKFPDDAGNPLNEAALWGAAATPANDGISNLLKYALGLNPHTPTVSPVRAESDADGHVLIDVARDPNAVGVRWTAEVSENLVDWFSGSGYTQTLIDEPDRLVVRDAVGPVSASQRFIRLRVTLE